MKLSIALILINVFVFLLTVSQGQEKFEYWINEFGFRASSFIEGKYYIIFTSLFLHANLVHLGFNMLALFLLGSSIEKVIDKKRYILAYFLGGMVANLIMLLPFLYSPVTIGIGASGAISSLVGLGTFLCPGKLVFFPSVFPLPFVVAGGIYFLSTLSKLFVPSQISYPVHMIGMLVGSLFGLAWSEDKKRKLLIFITVLVLLILIPYILITLGFLV